MNKPENKTTVAIGTSRARRNNGSTGFLAAVELKMARPPVTYNRRKGDTFIVCWFNPNATSYHHAIGLIR